MIHPAVIAALDARRAWRADTIHPDPAVRAARAAAAWQVLRAPSSLPAEVRRACHTVMLNATDHRRDTARRLLRQMEDDG